MIRILLVFLTFFSLDNLLVMFLPIQPLVGQYTIIPNAFLSCLSIFTFYDKDGKRSFILAGVFGIFYDVFYANLLGLYTCLFLIIIFVLRRFLVNSMSINLLSMIALMTGIIIFKEWTVYFLVETMSATHMTFMHFVQYVLFTSVLFNVVLMLIIYPILNRQFRKYQRKIDGY